MLNNSIKSLNLDTAIEKKLTENNIFSVKELWNLTRKDLKNLKFTNDEIKEIIIRLELNGLDLNKKVY